MRPARVRVSATLHESETPFVEDVQEAAEPRMQTERLSGRIGAHLQHLPCGHGNAWDGGCSSAASLIGDQRVQRVVATAKVDDDEVAASVSPVPPRSRSGRRARRARV